MSDSTPRSDLLPLLGQRASVEIAGLVVPPVVLISVPAGSPSLWSWVWAVAYWIGSIVIVLTRRQFKQDEQRLSPQAFEARWAARLERTALAFGLLWGLLTWTGVPIGSFEYSVFIYLVLCGTTLSTAAFAAADLRVLLRFLAPAWILASLAVPWAFGSSWMAVLPLCALYPWLAWRHARTSHGFLVQQSVLKRQSESLAQAHKVARDVAASASREKSLFLATASHDLRQPLYALTLTAHAAVQRNRDPSLGPLLVDIAQAASHVNDLLNSLLDVSSLDSRGADLPLQPVALTPLLCELHEQFLPEAQARQLEWRMRGPGEAAWVLAEPVLLRRALSNLLHNALRYTPSGGVLLAVRRRHASWAVEVWDTGVGIDEQERQRLFSAFERADDAPLISQEGHGLGLSVVRDCVRRLKGTIDWRSSVGRGSRFSIALQPARSPGAPSPASPSTGQPLSALSGRMLVVDDDLGVTQGLRLLLDDWGLEARIASDPAQAMAAMGDGFMPDVIMCDFRLRHGASGYALLASLLTMAPQAEALIVTGELDHPDLRSADEEGYLVLRKPVLPAELHGVLSAMLAGREPVRAGMKARV